MNIKKNFKNAEAHFKIAKDKFAAQDYEGALGALAKSSAHTRELMAQVFNLWSTKTGSEYTSKDFGL